MCISAIRERSGGEQWSSSPRKGDPLSAAPVAGQSGSLRRYTQNQLRVREHLVSLLNASGLRVGMPKSPSVGVHVYIQTTNILLTWLLFITLTAHYFLVKFKLNYPQIFFAKM
jgi:hypothetical protein